MSNYQQMGFNPYNGNTQWNQPAQPVQQVQQMGQSQDDHELGWDDVITKDAKEFVLLPKGNYEYTVASFERSRFNGSEKMSACNMAILKVRINTNLSEEGYIELEHRLFLHTKTEHKISEFFTSIGQKKKNEPLRMDWNKVIGARGTCEVGTKEYNGKTYNEIKRFLPVDDYVPF